MSLLSIPESLKFLIEILSISSIPNLPVTSLDSKQRVELLTKIVSSYLENEPFQSITLMSQDVDKRHRVPWEEIKLDIFSRRGGLCYSLNTFMFALLTSIGYDVSMAHATVYGRITHPNNHLVLLVSGLVVPDDKYVVDVGVGYAIPRPIPLEFLDESQEYTDSFQSYKFVKESNDMVILKLKKPLEARASSTSDDVIQHETTFEWRLLYSFNASESYVHLEEFYPCYDALFSDITKLPLQTSPRAMHWPNGRFLGLVETRLITEDCNGHLVKTELGRFRAGTVGDERCVETEEGKCSADVGGGLGDSLSDHDLVLQHYAQMFPQLSHEVVRAAFKNWRITGSLAKVPEHLA